MTAVTGGIAEGKSTVLGFVEGLGYTTLSADAVAKEVFEDPAVNRRLADAASAPWPISPETLRRAVSLNPGIRRTVNRIMHPLVLDRIQESRVDFVEIPLLIETCLQGSFSETWVVTCGPSEQRRRLIQRYGAELQGADFALTQLPTLVKIAFADKVFRTNRTLETVRRDVATVLNHRYHFG